MWLHRVSNPGSLALESDALPTLAKSRPGFSYVIRSVMFLCVYNLMHLLLCSYVFITLCID